MKLPIERRYEIDDEIDNILLETDKTYPEYRLQEIIESYRNVKAFEFDFGEDRNRINGAITFDKGNARIFINSSLPPARKTFTLAHEFGHYILHPNEDNLRLDYMKYDDSENSKKETEANYFAAAFLMPKERFVHIYRMLRDESQVARYFGVSIAAVRIRLRWIQSN